MISYNHIFLAPPPPTVRIFHSISLAMAGESLTLTCSATVQEGIGGSPTLMWSRGAIQQSTGSSLTFDPLLTSHGGVYTCTARLTIPEAGVDVSGLNATTVRVQSMPTSFNIADKELYISCSTQFLLL